MQTGWSTAQAGAYFIEGEWEDSDGDWGVQRRGPVGLPRESVCVRVDSRDDEVIMHGKSIALSRGASSRFSGTWSYREGLRTRAVTAFVWV